MAADLYRAQIASPLVILSGWENGRSRVRPGDELLGLLRGVRFAGADAVVASLWRVDDRAAAELTGAFCRHLESGHRAAAALRRGVDLRDSSRRGEIDHRQRFGKLLPASIDIRRGIRETAIACSERTPHATVHEGMLRRRAASLEPISAANASASRFSDAV